VSVEETLAAIDAAVGCQQCGKPLNGSVSDDFDSEKCQTAWHAARASRLVDCEPPRVSFRIGSDVLQAGWDAVRNVQFAYMRDRSGVAFDELIRTHDMLRTTLQNGDSE